MSSNIVQFLMSTILWKFVSYVIFCWLVFIIIDVPFFLVIYNSQVSNYCNYSECRNYVFKLVKELPRDYKIIIARILKINVVVDCVFYLTHCISLLRCFTILTVFLSPGSMVFWRSGIKFGSNLCFERCPLKNLDLI